MQTLPIPDVLADASRRFGLIVDVLCRGLGLWSARERPSPPHAGLAYAQVRRCMARVQSLLALLAAGRLPRSYPPRPVRAAANDPPAPEPTPARTYVRLPRRIGWLMAKDIEIRAASSQLAHWLGDPAVAAVLEQVPQARRPLAALCRMLAIPPWPHSPHRPLPPPKPRVRKPRPRKPRRPTLAEDRAAVWNHRCIETDSGWVRPGKRPWWMPARRRR